MSSSSKPPLAAVRYNDWRRLRVPPAVASAPVSVIVPYYEAPEALARLLAALETQDWPRRLFEVVVVDDGSRVPLTRPRDTPLDVTVVRQEDRGFGLARARNTGVRAAAHDVLLFLDGDMLPEAGWIAAHARWHQAVSGVLTLGFRTHVTVDGVTAAAVRERSVPLRELLGGPLPEKGWRERLMATTRELTSRHDNLFQAMVGANFGIRRDLYELAGGFDGSFVRWGAEDVEFSFRVFTRGAVLVPVRDAHAFHQGLKEREEVRRKNASALRQAPKLAHLIAHPAHRSAQPGRCYAVPQHVVTIAAAADLPASRVARTTATVLADRVHDFVVRIDLPEDDERLPVLRDAFGPDPRVHFAPAGRNPLDEFPASPFHVEVPAGAAFSPGILHRLRRNLGPAVSLAAALDNGARVSITRAWALHRARRTRRAAADFGDVISIPPWRLRVSAARISRCALRQRLAQQEARVRKALARLAAVRTPRQAWWFLEWLWGALRGRVAGLARPRTG